MRGLLVEDQDRRALQDHPRAIAAGAVLGLARALIAKKLIDHLSAHDATFGYRTA